MFGAFDLRATLVLSQAATSLSCPNLYPAISSSRILLASHKRLRPQHTALPLRPQLSVESAHCSWGKMKRLAWLLLIDVRALSKDQAQKRKMRDNDDIKVSRQTAMHHSEHAICVTEARRTDRQELCCSNNEGFAIRSRERIVMDDDHMRALVAQTHGKPIGHSSRMERPLDHPRSLMMIPAWD